MATTKRKTSIPLADGGIDWSSPVGQPELLTPKQEPAQAEQPSSMLRRTVGDTAVSAVKSAMAVPETLVGMADMVTGGYAGKLVQDAGVDFKRANEVADTLYSPEYQAASKKVQEADGIVATLKAAFENPSTIYHGAVTSAGSMLAGAPVGKAALMLGTSAASRAAIAAAPAAERATMLAAASRTPGWVAGAAAEGLASAGQNVEQVRQDSADGLLTPQQIAILGASGAITAGITAVAGKVANKLGIGDINQMIAGAQRAGPAVQKGLARSIAEGFATEGLLQEFPQSWQEQVAQNIAMGKPWDEGAANAAVMGGLSGGLLGGAAAPFGRGGEPPVVDPGQAVRDTKLPEGGPMTRAANAGIEAKAQAADAGMPVPPTMTAEQEAKALQGIEAQGAADAKGLKQYGNVGATMTARATASASPAAADASQPAAQPTATVTDMPFGDRVLTVREQLADEGTRQALRDRFGDDALNEATYYASVADRADIQMPEATREKLLALAERLVSESVMQPVNRQSLDNGASLAPQQLENGTGPEPARIGLDTSPTGVVRVDSAGNAAPETAADAIDTRNAAAGQTKDDTQARKASAVYGEPGPAPTQPLETPALTHDTTPTGRMRAGAAGVAPETRAQAIDTAQRQREAADEAQRQADMGLTPDVKAVQARNAMGRAQPGDLLNPKGEPFKHERAAITAQKKAKGGTVLQVAGGWVVRPEPTTVEASRVQDPQAAAVPAPAVAPAQQEGTDRAGAGEAAPTPAQPAARGSDVGAATGVEADGLKAKGFTYKIKPADGGGFWIESDDGGGTVMAGRPNGPGILNTVPSRKFATEQAARSYLAKNGMAEAASSPAAESPTAAAPSKAPPPAQADSGSAAPAPMEGAPAEPRRTERFESYKRAIEAADTVGGGMLEEIARDERLEDGEAEALAEMARPKTKQARKDSQPAAPKEDARTRRNRLKAEQAEPAPAERHPNQDLLDEYRAGLSALADRAFEAGAGKLSGQIRSYGHMKPSDKVLTPSFVKDALEGYEKIVAAAEKRANPAPAPAPTDTRKAEMRPYRREDGSIGYEAVPITPPAAQDSTPPATKGTADKPGPAKPEAAPGGEGAKPAPSSNTVFTDDAAEAARARLKAKLGRLNSGIDPEMLMDGITLAGWHIEKGARKFAAFARAMVSDLGEGVKPYLQSWYMAVRADPRAEAFKADMDKASAVEDLDVDEVLAEKPAAEPEQNGMTADEAQAEVQRMVLADEKLRPFLTNQTNDLRDVSLTAKPVMEQALVSLLAAGAVGGSAYDAVAARIKDATQRDAWTAALRGLAADDGAGKGQDTPAPAEQGDTSATEASDDSTPASSSPAIDQPVAQGQRPVSDNAARGAKQPRRKPGRADDRGVRDARGLFEGLDDEGGDVGNSRGNEVVPAGADGTVAGGGDRVLAPDFRPAVGGLKREGSWHATAARNLDLIDLARQIESENRPATPEEQERLSKYVGFGASEIRNAMFPVPTSYQKQAAKPGTLIFPEAVYEARWKALAERAAALPVEWQRTILQSTQYAHYTSEAIIRSMWSGMQRLGFTGGKVFEAGSGIGSFAMLMPDAVRSTSNFTGIEFDGPTALIARLLSPQQNMLHDDFIKRRLPDNFFDVAVGNPPFSQTKITADPRYQKHGFMLHDYFFAKSLDKLRPGGVLAYVTSKGTMDKQSDKARRYLMERADLLGAIRLPSTAFEDNAGTSVVTDVIFLRKRLPGEAPAGHKWAGVATVDTKDGPVVVNEYFAANPDMVLGQQRISGNTDDMGRRINSNGRGGEKYTVVSYDKTPEELDAKFAAAIERLPANVYAPLAAEAQTVRTETAKIDFDPAVKREGVVYVGKDGALLRVEDGIGKPLSDSVKLSAKDQAWLTDYVGVRDLVKAAQLAQVTDGPWEAALKKLNKGYDAFVKKHGPINAFRVQVRKSTDEDGREVENSIRIFTNRRLFREDYDSALMTQLEVIDEDGNVKKAPFLTGRTIGKPVTREVRSIGDALAVSLDAIGSLNLDDVAARLHISRDEAIDALGSQVYREPGGDWLLADEYLSGNVVEKLAQAIDAARLDPGAYERNVEALKAVQPEKLGPSQISVKLGAPWVDAKHVSEFAKEIEAGEVTFDHKTETWQVQGGNERSRRRAGAEWGTAARSPSELLEAILNSRSIKVMTKTADKKDVVDQEATTAANEMAKKIKDKFKSWVWTDSERAADLVEAYNERYNNLAPRVFDGSHLTLPGVSLRKKIGAPFEHQAEMLEKWAALKALEEELRLEGLATPGGVTMEDGTTEVPADLNEKQTGNPAANTADVAFSRGQAGEQQTVSSSRRKAVEALVALVASRWANAPEVVVVDSMDDPRVPEGVRKNEQTQQSQGADGAPEGFFHGGKVYLVAPQLGGDADVIRVLMHEALGHYGLRGVFGAELGTILDRVAILQAAKVRAKAKQYGLDMDKLSQRRLAAEEVLADMAQRTPTLGWGQKAIAAVRTWLREHIPGFTKMALTDAEIVRSYILPARAFVQRGGPGGGGGGGQSADRKSDDVAYSRASTLADSVRNFDQAAARNAFIDAVTTHGGTNFWGRTVGTQYHKAITNPTTFGRVFNAVQDYIKATSTFANQAADLAPSLLPKLDTWRDLVKDGPLRHGADPKDTEAAAKAIFRGTLDKVLYSADQLRSQFGLTDKQVGLYREFRASVDESLNGMAKAEILRMAGEDGRAVRERVLAAPDLDAAAEALVAHLTKLAETTANDNLLGTVEQIGAKVARVQQLQAEGYAPLMRFGKHTLHITREDGGTEFFGMYESVRDANKAARLMRADPALAGMNFQQGVMSEQGHKLFNGMSLDALELFADATGNEQNPVYQEYLKLAIANRSALKRMIERKAIAGYSEDAARVLASFVTSNARMAAGNLHLSDAKKAAEAMPKEQGDLRDDAINLVDYVTNPSEEAAAVRGLLFTTFIGGSVASALVNMTQPITMTLPYLTQWGGAVKAGKRLLAAAAMVGTGQMRGSLAAALQRAERDGIVSPQEIHHLQAQAMNTLGKNPFLKKAAFVWGSMFSLAEQFNRRVSFVAAYQTAEQEGIRDPFGFAERAVVETQGLYNKGNKANVARGAVGATVMTFKQFSTHYLEFLVRMSKNGPEGKKAVGVALALLMLMAGAGGLPFADDLDDLIDTLGQALGYDTNSKRAKREFIAKTLGMGEDAAEVLTRGLTALPGIPIDLSLRMGLGNLIPATGLFLRSNTDTARQLLEVAGAAGGLAANVKDGMVKALGGDVVGGAMNAMPTAIRNMAQAVTMWNTGEYRNTKGAKVMDVDALDAVAKGIGFQPAAVARESARVGEMLRTVQLAKNVEGEIAGKWAQALVDGDSEAATAARQSLADWNRKNPEAPIKITMPQVLRRVRELRMSRADRTVKAAPKELRGTVAEAMK